MSPHHYAAEDTLSAKVVKVYCF